jgi:hypothetical protein
VTGVDRNHALEVLGEAHQVQDERARHFGSRSLGVMTLQAETRTYTLTLLMDAIEAGLLEQLHDQAQQSVLADIADEERWAAEEKYRAGMTASPLSSTPLAIAFGDAPALAGLRCKHDTAIAAGDDHDPGTCAEEGGA